jgi:nitrate reductase gamma subunit
MKKKPLILEELMIWLRGRFSLTSEEKVWMLLILVICWVGLVSRYFYVEHQSSQQMKELTINDE